MFVVQSLCHWPLVWKHGRLDAYRLWQLLEAICKEDSDDEDQEEDEESLEEYTTSKNYTHPLVTSSNDQGRKEKKSASSLLEPVRPVCVTGQTRERRKESKKCSRRRSRQTQASYESTSSSDVDHKCLTAENKKEDSQGVNQAMKFKEELDRLKIIYASLVRKFESLSTNSLSRIDTLEKKNQVLKAKLEKLTSEHVALQGTHMELEKSYEKLVDSMSH